MGFIKRLQGFSSFVLNFLLGTWRMRKLVGDFKINCESSQSSKCFAIVVMPWVGTTAPWFSLVCGLFLASKGNKVSFIIDDMPFAKDGFSFKLQIFCIQMVLRLLHGKHELITLSQHVSSRLLTQRELQSIGHLAKLNAVWELRGEMLTAGRQQHAERSIFQLSSSYAAIANLLNSSHFDVLFVPGGVWGSSGVWIEHARNLGLRVASYDSGGYNVLLLAVNGIACQLQDIPRAFTLLKASATSVKQRTFVIKYALDEINRRRSGTDKFAYQMKADKALNAQFTGAVLLALNSSWDSAALGLHAVFESSEMWMVETVKYLLNHTLNAVIVRQHPIERLEIARSSDNYRELLFQHFGENPRLHFIAADDPVNSYDLLQQVIAVLAYTSTIGVEAAAHGKVVLTESNSYYSDMGFVWKATNIAQYHQYLTDAVDGKLVVTNAMKEDALFCYYITQCCNWMVTPFTIPGFVEWSRKDLQQLFNDESVQLIIKSIEENMPISYLNHLALIKEI